MKSLLTTLLLCIALVIGATVPDNNPRLVRLKGFKGLSIAPTGGANYNPTNFLNLFGWWRPEGLTNAADGLPVNYWQDDSGHSLHMRTEVSTAAPLASNNVQNGWTGVWFDGVTNYMTNACSPQQTNIIFMVISTRAMNDSYTMILDHRNRADLFSGLALFFEPANMTRIYPYACGNVNYSPTIPNTNTMFTLVVQYAGTGGQVWTNGVLMAFGNTIFPCGWNGGMTVGTSVDVAHFFRGYIMEMFCVTNAYVDQVAGVSGTIVQTGCRYLRDKYAHY